MDGINLLTTDPIRYGPSVNQSLFEGNDHLPHGFEERDNIHAYILLNFL